MSITVTDPYNNRVVILQELIPKAIYSIQMLETIDSPDKVIARPAMILTTCEGLVECCAGSCINHYFRLIGPDATLLISAQKDGEVWVAFSCIQNPSFEQLKSLFQNARTL